MMDTFLLYLLTRVGDIQGFFYLLGLIGAIIILTCVVISPPVFDFEADKIKPFIASLKWKVVACISLIFFAVLIPSRNDVIFIFGGAAVLEAVRSERAKSIGTKTLDVIEGYLDDTAKEGSK